MKYLFGIICATIGVLAIPQFIDNWYNGLQELLPIAWVAFIHFFVFISIFKPEKKT